MNEIKIEICNVKLAAHKTHGHRMLIINTDSITPLRGFELTPEDACDLGRAITIAAMALFPATNDDEEY